MASVDTKIRALRDELSLVIHRESKRIEQLLATIQSIQTRVDNLETQGEKMTDVHDEGNGNGIHAIKTVRNPLDNPDITVVVTGL